MRLTIHKGPCALSDSVGPSDQLLREISGEDQWNRVSYLSSCLVVGFSLMVGRGLPVSVVVVVLLLFVCCCCCCCFLHRTRWNLSKDTDSMRLKLMTFTREDWRNERDLLKLIQECCFTDTDEMDQWNRCIKTDRVKLIQRNWFHETDTKKWFLWNWSDDTENNDTDPTTLIRYWPKKNDLMKPVQWHYSLIISCCRDSLLLKRRSRDRKVASSNPGRIGGGIFFSGVNFVCWLLFGVRFTPVFLQWQVKDPGQSAKSASGRLHLNMQTLLTPQSRKGWLCHCSGIVWKPIWKRAHTKLVREHSATVVSARWAIVNWS